MESKASSGRNRSALDSFSRFLASAAAKREPIRCGQLREGKAFRLEGAALATTAA